MPATSFLWPRDGVSVGLPNPPKMAPLSVPGFHFKMPRSGTLQDGQLTLRLVNACALQDIRVALVRHLSWLPIRLTLVLGCLSSRGSLGLALGFYRARVRRLDIADFNRKGELGQPSMAGALSGYAPPTSPETSATWSSRFKRAEHYAASCCSGSTPWLGSSHV